MTSLDEALRALEKDLRECARASDRAHMTGAAEDFRDAADRLQAILNESDRQEVAPVAGSMVLDVLVAGGYVDPTKLEQARAIVADLSPAQTSEARGAAVMKLLDERIAAETNKTRRWALICFRDAAMRQEAE